MRNLIIARMTILSCAFIVLTAGTEPASATLVTSDQDPLVTGGTLTSVAMPISGNLPQIIADANFGGSVTYTGFSAFSPFFSGPPPGAATASLGVNQLLNIELGVDVSLFVISIFGVNEPFTLTAFDSADQIIETHVNIDLGQSGVNALNLFVGIAATGIRSLEVSDVDESVNFVNPQAGTSLVPLPGSLALLAVALVGVGFTHTRHTRR